MNSNCGMISEQGPDSEGLLWNEYAPAHGLLFGPDQSGSVSEQPFDGGALFGNENALVNGRLFQSPSFICWISERFAVLG